MFISLLKSYTYIYEDKRYKKGFKLSESIIINNGYTIKMYFKFLFLFESFGCV